MPPEKRVTRQEMDELTLLIRNQQKTLDHQSDMLQQIIWQITGNEKLGIEGVKPGQKRLEQKITNDTLELKKWQDNIQKYFDVVTSRPFKVFVFLIVISFAGLFIYVKGGIMSLWKFITGLL